MKASALILLTLACASSSNSWASPQQDRMKNCNADAKTKGLSGQARKDFMRSCLSGKAEAAPAADAATASTVSENQKPTDAKERMKWCNAKAAGKKGDERKAFMSSCLKAG